MKKMLLFLILVPMLAKAQTKSLLMTVPEDEYVDTDNTKVIPTATGAEYFVVTYDDYQKYYSYTKTEKRKVFAVDIWEDDVVISGKENGLKYFKAKATGEKYGPYEGINPHYNLGKKELYGYAYVQEGKTYFVDMVNKKNYGPIEGGGLWYLDDRNVVYSYTETTKDGKQVHLMENGTRHGPFEQVSYKRAEFGKASPIIVYRKDKQYYVNQKPWLSQAFAGHPSFTELQNGWAILAAAEASKPLEKLIYLPNGKKYEYFDKLKHSFNSQGQVLRLEHVGGGGSDAAYKVTYNGKEIGTFAVKKSLRQDLIKNDFFDHQLTKVELKQNNWPLAYRDENYFYSPTKGLVGPFTQADISKIYFIADGYATTRADSTLEINGKKVLDDVVMVDFGSYPVTWWALQQQGDYAVPFKNGVEVPLSELPKNLSYYHTKDKPIVKVRRPDNIYFLRVTATGKLLGPVSQYSESTTSKDLKHYIAVMDETENVVVDGKVVGRGGFNLTYNEKLNAFHWFTQSGQQLYLHTYKLSK